MRQVHDLQGHERKQWLRMATFLVSNRGLEQGQKMFLPRSQVLQTSNEKQSREPRKRTHPVNETQQPIAAAKRPKLAQDVSTATEPYPYFMFRHKFSLFVVGATQSRKTYFVKRILTSDWILYEAKKPRHISWYYSQWQDGYEALKTKLGKEIQFFRGLPDFHDDLREIDTKYNNVLIFDDLMTEHKIW